MNKILISALLLAATSVSTSAAVNELTYPLSGPKATSFKLNGAEVGDEVRVASMIPTTSVSGYAGAKIESVEFLTGTNYNTQTNVYSVPRYKEVTVFVTSNLYGEPEFSKKVDVVQEQYGVNRVALDRPYELKAGETVWVGYSVVLVNENDYYMPADYIKSSASTSNYSAIIKKGETGVPNYSSHVSDEGALCFTVNLIGSLPQGAVKVNSFDLPYAFNTEGGNSIKVNVTNVGAADAQDATFTYSVAGVSKTYTSKILDPETLQPAAIKPFESGVVELAEMTTDVVGLNTPMNFTVTQVNGFNNPFSGMAVGSATCPSYSFSKAFTRIPVMEEGTSIACQWCPAGHALLDYIHEKYGDGFIIMAYHNNFGQSRDPMLSQSGLQFLNYYVKTYPYGIYNRRDVSRLGYDGMLSSLAAAADKVYDRAVELHSYADMEFDAEFVYDEAVEARDEENEEQAPVPTGIKVNVDVQFLFDVPETELNPYMLSFVIVENDRGPFKQINSYSGAGDRYEMGGWEDKGPRVEMMFDNVVRELIGFPGIEGSLPTGVEAGKTYNYNTVLDMGKASGIKTRVVALLTNSVTREIINARQVYLYDRTPDGIETVNAAAVTEGPVVWYTLQGVRVNEPTAAGIYIRVNGNKSEKVLVK